MNELMLFNNEEFGEIRGKLLEDLCWFVGRDVIRDLGYEISKSMSYTYYIKKYCDEDDIKKVNNCDAQLFGIEDAGRKGELLINEYALYDLVFESPLPSAKKFKRWVTHEVLPSIRKTGKYESQNSNNSLTSVEIKMDNVIEEINIMKTMVPIKKKDSNIFVKQIKRYLGINTISEDKYSYNTIKDMFLIELNVSKFEDIPVNKDNILVLDRICKSYKRKYEQLNMFD